MNYYIWSLEINKSVTGVLDLTSNTMQICVPLIPLILKSSKSWTVLDRKILVVSVSRTWRINDLFILTFNQAELSAVLFQTDRAVCFEKNANKFFIIDIGVRPPEGGDVIKSYFIGLIVFNDKS